MARLAVAVAAAAPAAPAFAPPADATDAVAEVAAAAALAQSVLMPRRRYQQYLANFSFTLDVVEDYLTQRKPRPGLALEVADQLWLREDQLHTAFGCPYACDERRCSASDSDRCSSRALANIWALQAPLAFVRYLLYAFASLSPGQTPHKCAEGRWGLQFGLKCARTALTWGLDGFVAKPPVWAATFSQSWLAAAPTRWPRSDGLLGTVLADLGCPRANASLGRVLAGAFAGDVEGCRQDLAVLDVQSWTLALPAGGGGGAGGAAGDLFDALLPRLMARAGHGRSLHRQVLQTVLRRHLAPDAHEPGALFLEFGVHRGASLEVIAQHLRALGAGRVYGFDSFLGLPQAWPGGGDEGWAGLPQGHFRVEALPRVDADHAELVVGLFNESLPRFLGGLPAAPAPRLRLVHLDADLYASTLEVLGLLRALLASPSAVGCILVFDDLVNFEGFRAPTSALAALEAFLRQEALLPEPRALARLEVVAAPSDIWFGSCFGASRGDWTDERTVAFRVLPAAEG